MGRGALLASMTRRKKRERDSVPQASKQAKQASKREGEIYRRNLARRKATQSLVQIVIFHLLAMGLCGLLHHWKRIAYDVPECRVACCKGPTPMR